MPWGKDMKKYIAGNPDRLRYTHKDALTNSKGEVVRESMHLINPLKMSEADAAIWTKHIIASEKGEVPKEEALCFVGMGGRKFTIHGAREKLGVGENEPVPEGGKRKRRRKKDAGGKGKEKRKRKKKTAAREGGGSSESEAEFSGAESEDDVNSEDFGDEVDDVTDDEVRSLFIGGSDGEEESSEDKKKQGEREKKEKEEKEKQKGAEKKEGEKDGQTEKKGEVEHKEGSVSPDVVGPPGPGLEDHQDPPSVNTKEATSPLQEGKLFKQRLQAQVDLLELSRSPEKSQVAPPSEDVAPPLPLEVQERADQWRAMFHMEQVRRCARGRVTFHGIPTKLQGAPDPAAMDVDPPGLGESAGAKAREDAIQAFGDAGGFDVRDWDLDLAPGHGTLATAPDDLRDDLPNAAILIPNLPDHLHYRPTPDSDFLAWKRRIVDDLVGIPPGNIPAHFFGFFDTPEALGAFLCDDERYFKVRHSHTPDNSQLLMHPTRV